METVDKNKLTIKFNILYCVFMVNFCSKGTNDIFILQVFSQKTK